MPIIRGRENAKAVYAEAAARGWVIPCFCTENLTTTEAILSAAAGFARANGLSSVPVTVAVTVRYAPRPQAVHFTHTRRWDIGLKLFLAELEVLCEEGGAFDCVDVLVHLDHVQHDLDEALFGWDLRRFSSIMYDASSLPIGENMRKTAAFVRAHGGELLIEGACDEIRDADGGAHCDVTASDVCERYKKETGVDMVVANLGTEHRASGADLRYHGDAARAIRDRIGHAIVLHGCSSVSADQVRSLYLDGVCKVNIWTALERDSAPALFRFLAERAGAVSGPEAARLKAEGYLGPNAPEGRPDLSAFATSARQAVVFEAMKKLCYDYFGLWYR